MIKLYIDADTDACIHNQGGSPHPGVDFAKSAFFNHALPYTRILHGLTTHFVMIIIMHKCTGNDSSIL